MNMSVCVNISRAGVGGRKGGEMEPELRKNGKENHDGLGRDSFLKPDGSNQPGQ